VPPEVPHAGADLQSVPPEVRQRKRYLVKKKILITFKFTSYICLM
jgi:hypothetical protein